MATLSHSSARRPRSGFTILEVVVAITIIMVLVVFLAPGYSGLVARAQEAKCMGNMRAIHGGLLGYLADHKEVWPQGPPPANDAAWSAFWIATLEPYGVEPRNWLCPTIESLLRDKDPEAARPDIGSLHYQPTMFDSDPLTAKRLSTPPLNQPWLIESADAHGKGALICFGDGSIKPFNKVLAEMGVR